MKQLTLQIFLVLFSLLSLSTKSFQHFCSVYCYSRSCTSNLTNTCGSCYPPFKKVSSLCVLDSASGYTQIDTSDDIGGGLVSMNLVASSGSCINGSGFGQWSYFFYGNLTASTQPAIMFQGQITQPHYAVRVIYWVITVDNWAVTDSIITTLDGTSLYTKISTRWAYDKVCGNSNKTQNYVRPDVNFTHNSTDTFLLNISSSMPSTSGSVFGVKQIIILAKICNTYCQSCYGSLITQCYSCITGQKLSGTTCNQSCLTGYGDTSGGLVCVLCNVLCLVCFDDGNYCLSCQNASSTYASFLLQDSFTCVVACPTGMYGNVTDRICYECDSTCLTCTGTSVYCFQCDHTLSYYWYQYTCYSPCPQSTFLATNNINCTACSPYCLDCTTNSTYCQTCTVSGTYKAYLYSANSSCLRVCPSEYYELSTTDLDNVTVNTCEACFIGCYQCTDYPSPCTQCNYQYWLFESTCGLTCPALYFKDNVTWTCLLCELWCVQMTMSMYFSDSVNSQIYVDFSFTEVMDFGDFPYQSFQSIQIDSSAYTLAMFDISYQILSNRSYRVIMEPKGYIFLYNATIICTTMAAPTTVHTAENGRPFKLINYGKSLNLVWFIIKTPDMSATQKKIINSLSNVSSQITQFTTLPYVQEIKKTGIFGLLMSGAQITTCSVLVNNIPSQNLYEGVRFWGSFVFFDVPLWQKSSNKTRYAIVPSVSSIVSNSRLLQQRRRLFDISSTEWRFQRTGFTTFFLFDVYSQLLLIGLSWLLVLIGYCLNKHKPLLFRKHMGKFYTFLHKCHEIAIMYVMISTILQWFYFDASSVQRWLSFIICLLVNVYMLMYHMYIYYDMIKYPASKIGTEKYQYYVVKYGCFLKNLRFQEYDLKQPWSPRQWFRPYNYHILSFYKKVLMVISLPLFYNILHAESGVLIFLQSLEIVRFVFTWPFFKNWRNIYRLVLEVSLLLFFVVIFFQGLLVQQIMLNDQDTIQWTIQIFYRLGWVGFALVFLFNIGFIMLFFIDLVIGCRKTNREMIDEARRQFYYRKLKGYEKQKQIVPLKLINKMVKLGNLNVRDYDRLPDINIRIQNYRINKIKNGEYHVQMKKISDLSMNVEFDFHDENNISPGKKFDKKFIITSTTNSIFLQTIEHLFKKYSNLQIQFLTIKTFQLIEQSNYKPGDLIQLDRSKLSQKLQIEGADNNIKDEHLEELLEGFPITQEEMQKILSQ